MNDFDPRAKRGHGTRAVHGPAGSEAGAMSTPIVHSAAFSFATLEAMLAERERRAAGAFYQRLGHPTLHACEERLADLGDAEAALLFPSGMAAISSVFLAYVKSGEHIVAIRQCYGGTLEALRWGSEHLGWVYELVDARAPDSWERAFRDTTRIFHVESPTNPTLCVVDLRRAAEVAHRHGAKLTVDNTVASPIGQRPLEFGADFALHSATKSISGHTDLLSGVVLGSSSLLDGVYDVRKILGAVPDPTSAWLIERSLKTIALRVERANANALEIARRLSRQPAVRQVFYPGLDGHPGQEVAARQMSLGFGPLFAFEVRGGLDAAEAVVSGFRVVAHAASLGGVETLTSLPVHTSHRQMNEDELARAGIPPGLVRISAGIEDIEDLWADFEQALARVAVAETR